MSQITEQIKEKIDIAEFLKEYIQLLPAGRNFRALCPFHKESNPSLMVSPDRQSWYCFGGCNEGGDIFSFLMKYENLEFHEALKVLAEKAGINLQKTYGVASDYKQYGVLYSINEAARDFFKSQLKVEKAGGGAGVASTYLSQRGLKKETIEDFELGVSPTGADELTVHLTKLGFSIQDIERAGLAVKTERGTYRDRFRNRIIFPLHNSFGKVVGFTGRLFKSESGINDSNFQPPKYLNSPETPIFNKSRILYGLHKAKKHIRANNWALLVEGQMDLLLSYQDDVKNVIASSGTALTNDHLKNLRRLTDRLILCFDSDEAGQLAAERSIDLANTHDFVVRILSFTEGKDPADIVNAKEGSLIELIKGARPAIEFYLQRHLNKEALEKESLRRRGIKLFLTKINHLSSAVERSIWLKKLASHIGISEQILAEESARIKKPVATEQQASNQPTNRQVLFPRKQLIAYRILDLGGELSKENSDLVYSNEGEKEIDEQLAMKAGLENSHLAEEDKQAELQKLSRQLNLEVLKDKQQILQQAIRRAEADGKEEDLAKAIKEFDIVSKEFHNVSNAKGA